MTRPVVVGLDGSAESVAAAEWAAAEALRRTAPLRLVSACGLAPAADMAPETPDALRRATERLLTRTHDELLARHRGLAVYGEAVADGPVAALVEASRHAELVALGSRGLGAFTGFLLGSVSAPVIAHAACPVVVVRARTTVGGGAGSEVVVGLKRLGEPDPEVLDFAFGAADRQGLVLRVVHTWRGTLPPSPHRLAPSDAPEEGERYASALADALRPWQVRHPDVAVRGTLLSGNASQALIGAAAHAALVVVGRGGRQTGHGRRVGAVVHALLHHCAVPVAVVPHT